MCKKVRFYNLCAVPTSIGVTTFINFLPPKFANLQFLFINNLLVQTIFRTSDLKSFRLVRESKILSTLLFMSFSSLIMGLMALTAGERHRYWLVYTLNAQVGYVLTIMQINLRYAQNNETMKCKKGSQEWTAEEKALLKDLIYKVYLVLVVI